LQLRCAHGGSIVRPVSWYKRFGVLTVIALWLVSGIFAASNQGSIPADKGQSHISSLNAAALQGQSHSIQPDQQLSIPAIRPGAVAAYDSLGDLAAETPAGALCVSALREAGSFPSLLARTWQFHQRAAAFPRSPTGT